MQTTVNSAMDIGVAGQLADLYTEENGDVLSATSQEASAEIPFGVMVQKGTSDDGVKLLSAANNKLAGVVVYASLYNKPTQLGDTGLKPGVTFDRLMGGRILVLVEEAVAVGDEVHVRHTTSTTEQVGGFRKSAVSNKTLDISAFAQWRTAAGAGELAVLDIDMNDAANAVADT